MSKSTQEMATEITVAWLQTMGKALESTQSSHARRFEELASPEKVGEFYKAIVKSVNESFNISA